MPSERRADKLELKAPVPGSFEAGRHEKKSAVNVLKTVFRLWNYLNRDRARIVLILFLAVLSNVLRAHRTPGKERPNCSTLQCPIVRSERSIETLRADMVAIKKICEI